MENINQNPISVKKSIKSLSAKALSYKKTLDKKMMKLYNSTLNMGDVKDHRGTSKTIGFTRHPKKTQQKNQLIILILRNFLLQFFQIIIPKKHNGKLFLDPASSIFEHLDHQMKKSQKFKKIKKTFESFFPFAKISYLISEIKNQAKCSKKSRSNPSFVPSFKLLSQQA